MYIGIDIGGTKTLVGCLDEQGVLQEQVKFLTPKKYSDFLQELATIVAKLSTKEYRAGSVAIPGKLDRKHGRTIAFGNLTWGQVPIQADVERITGCPILIENDANLAGLSEAMLLKDQYEQVLYITVSTGIGSGVINHGRIDTAFEDSEAGSLILEHNGALKRWETFASGKAIVEQFGKKAVDIKDEQAWKTIAHNLALGLVGLIAFMQPDVIVLGGSVGNHLTHYKSYLDKELQKFSTPLTPTPPILEAQRPETAVLYGCYDLARARYGPST